jgi:flagellar biosynthesis protein FliP
MITYLKSLYPHKTLTSVANEILKLTGQKMSGRGRKSPTVTEIAKYVIGAIGAALAIALAIFIINNEIEEEKHYQKSLIKIESDRQRERQRMADEKREEINRKQVEDSRKRAADQINNDLQKERDLMNRINQQREYEKRSTTNDYRSTVDPVSKGGARLNPAVQTMLTYLKSLYPHKTLMSVANEILKLTGQKLTGKGRKSPTATEIAKYVIGAIGAALAIALAIFILSNDDTSIKQSNIHPRLDKPGPKQIDTYPYTPSYTPTTTSSSSKPDVSLENLYSDPSLPSYTNMMNPGFGKVGIPKKKSGDKYSEYPSSSGTFSGNPKGYGRKKRRLKKKKVM